MDNRTPMEEYQLQLQLAQSLLKVIYEETGTFVTLDPETMIFQTSSANPYSAVPCKISSLQCGLEDLAEDLDRIMSALNDLGCTSYAPTYSQHPDFRHPREESHHSKQPPSYSAGKGNPSRQSSGPPRCKRCHKRGHYDFKCKSPRPQKPCPNCLGTHWLFDCPERRK